MAISIVNPYAVAAAGPFDPETAFNWHTLYWAEGTKSKALNYANGDRLTTISDEYGVAADNLTMSPSSPYYVYRSGSSLMNGQPCWYSQTTHGTMTTGTWVKTPPALALNSVVILYEPSVHGNYPWLISGVASQQIEIYEFTNSPYSLKTTGSFDTGLVPTLGIANGITWRRSNVAANNLFSLNGATPVVTTAQPNLIGGITIASRYDGNYTQRGATAFVGIYDGDITQDPKYADLQSWALSHYGAVL